jgi:hypothetical protein
MGYSRACWARRGALPALVLGVVVAVLVAAAPAAATNYEFVTFQGQRCHVSTTNTQSGTAGQKTIHFSTSIICDRAMHAISMYSTLTNGSAKWGGGWAQCLAPSPCGPVRLTSGSTVTGRPSGVYAHETEMWLDLPYASGDFWIVADERQGCTYTSLTVKSGSLHCTLVEPIIAEP